MTITEHDVVRGLISGSLSSPVEYYNAHFYLVRVSGTRAAYRESLDEFVWRDPAIWLTAEMADRWRGAPVILMHPPGQILNGRELARRVVGSIMTAFVRGEELWGVARIIDADAAELVRSDECDTSPSCVFAPSQIAAATFKEPSGKTMFVEPEPVLVDHLAIVARGVWSKGEPDPTGIEVSHQEAEEAA